MMRTVIFTLLMFVTGLAGAQTQQYFKYWVQFTDKNNIPYTIDYPQAFLSDKAIERREKYNIPIDATDLPINQHYVDSIRQTGVTVLNHSKWFNAITIETTDSVALDEIRAMPFVHTVEPVAVMKIEFDNSQAEPVVFNNDPIVEVDAKYGVSYSQIQMLGGDYLHELGFRGEGMTIAVLDVGFRSIDRIMGFDSLFQEGRMLGTYDFVDLETPVYEDGTHGRNVLSIMAANLPGFYVGSAPAADYYLFRTEDGASENRIEEDNWVSAIEMADSLGVDLINSSLGYSVFDDTSMNYTYSDMNGNTARITRAADMASDKGILIVTSAGNEGSSSWHYVTAPADGKSVLTVGAIDADEKHATFSSFGPTSDGRVKPDVCGQGVLTAYLGDGGDAYVGNGTSYSSPLVAGLVACLWQALPDLSNSEIIQLLQSTASLANDPNDSMGYGVVNFRAAHFKKLQEQGPLYQQRQLPIAYPNPFSSNLRVMVYANEPGEFTVDVFDGYGTRVYYEERYVTVNRYANFDLSDLDYLPKGVYIVRVNYQGKTDKIKVIKW